jgi:hypothetical protein
MSTDPNRNQLPARIREAVASEEFSKAQFLWEQYAEQFCSDIGRGPVPESRFREACELADWTRITALCARAFARDRLARIAVAQQYEGAANRSPSIVAVRG